MKKFIKVTLLSLIGILLIAVLVIVYSFTPIMAGMAAKTVCSCVYVSGRTVESVREKELTVFPTLSKAGIEVNNGDSTVTATVLLAKAKAIYRKGLGCTLLAERSEEDVRAQQFSLAKTPTYAQDTLTWPMGDRLPDSIDVRIDQARIDKALQVALTETDPTKPKNTLAVVVLYKGQLIAEQYADYITPQSKLMGWSMTKSITNALIGLLVKDGKLRTEDPAPVPEWKDDERSAITLNNLLQASSGLKWSETYFNPFQDFHQMFIHSDDKGAFAASRPLVQQPNTHFQYSSASTNIMSRMIRQQLGDTLYHRFPYERLFYKIGMFNTIIEPDASGTFVGSSYSFATARDWARFGLLYYNDGVWNGERILPEGWVKYTTTPATTPPQGEYGAQWWLNAGAPDHPENRKYPDLPRDTYWADGFEEQYVMVIPSEDLVIVRLGISHHGFDMVSMVNEIIASLPND
ncbi:MAG: class C beta-lactamase-related serine hydrolase [Cytophagia bacterium]|nr:class C beta-lactamase-related serine hydrolase [Cytophagia bacterium]